jgi:hypothetical protein
MTTGAEELVVQITDGPRFVVDCRVKPVALAAQAKITLEPEVVIVNCGGVTASDMLKIVPRPAVPP